MAALDPTALAARCVDPGLVAGFRAARPFPHAVLDDLVPPAVLAGLLDAFADEPARVLHDPIFEVLASAPVPADRRFSAFTAALGSPEVRGAVGALAEARLARVDGRAFGYQPGHFLLPHTDADADATRAVAYAFYVDVTPDLEGGELVLYDADLEGTEIVAAREARVIAPRANRMVLFAVGPRSLHEVREVTCGHRVSVAGWFYR